MKTKPKRGVLKYIIILFFIFFVVFVTFNNINQKNLLCEDCNLIIIGIDTLRADHLGYYNYERNITTLNNLADNSYVFKNTITQASWTLPSFMSLFTSTYPHQHKIINKFYINDEGEIETSNLKILSPGIVTLTEILKQEGYKTGGFTGDAGVCSEFGFSEGFDYYYDKDIFGGFNKSFTLAELWISKNKNHKFFAFIHGYDCHGEFELDYEKRLFSKDSNFIYNGTMEEEIALREKGLEEGYLNLSKNDLTFWKNLYDDKIVNMDNHLSNFIQYLKDEELMNKTILVIVSDHGDEFLEHGKIDHGATLYDELLKVVFMIKLPNDNKRVIEEQVRLIDVMPTVLDLLNIKTESNLKKQIQGISLQPLMKGKSLFLDAFSETDYRMFVSKKSLRTHNGWKLIVDSLSNSAEIYDLTNDPHETNNLITSKRDKYNELKKKLIFYSNTELDLDLLTDNIIHLNSEEFKKFKLIESFELKEKTLYNFIKNNEYLKIEKTKNINEETAKKLINNDIIQIKALFSSSLSPYPGEISNEIECADEFKPILFKTEIGDDELQYLTTYSNDRFGIGVCSKDLIKFRYLIGWIYCPKMRELYKIRYFIPLEENYEKLKEFFINIRCDN